MFTALNDDCCRERSRSTSKHRHSLTRLVHESDKYSAATAAILTATSASASESVPASNKVNLAFVGVRGRGLRLLRAFGARADCNIAYICDVDQSVVATPLKEMQVLGHRPPTIVQDFRRALDDKSIDAVVIATPDHWHALASIWACQAGKDVYVEKPISYSIWEGRQMVEAARKYDRIVQVGTQNRSAPYVLDAKRYIDSGKLGSINLVKVFNQKYQSNLSQMAESEPPAHIDWYMWQGPATQPGYSLNVHNHWNAFWQFSGGDIANDAVHQLDLARWMVGVGHPETVYSTGKAFTDEGVSEMPCSQVAVYEFPNLVMTLELTLNTPYMIKSDQLIRDSDMFPHWPQNTERVELFGSKGLMVLGRMGAGWQVFDRQKNRIVVVAAQAYGRYPDPPHQQNFVDSIRSRQKPNADILDGHLSTLLCHAANISYRLGGRKLAFDSSTELFRGDAEANSLLKREYRAPWIVPDTV
jgi:predicted dehydrogenase